LKTEERETIRKQKPETNMSFVRNRETFQYGPHQWGRRTMHGKTGVQAKRVKTLLENIKWSGPKRTNEGKQEGKKPRLKTGGQNSPESRKKTKKISQKRG